MIQTTNKRQMVCMYIARELLVMHLKGNTRLPSVKEYAQSYNVGIGTIQDALRSLQDEGIIELNACGAQGTFLVRADRRKLFDACAYGELVCMMPLDTSACLRGLATGVYEAISAAGLPVHILFARGSKNRMRMVKWCKCDFAVMSRLAYETALELGEHELQMVDIIGRYPDDYGCVTRVGSEFHPGETPVLYDRHSYDQLALHRWLALPEETPGDWLDVQLIDLVRQGRAEAALCKRASVQGEEDLCFHELSALPDGVRKMLQESVLVVRAEDNSLCKLLRCLTTYEKVFSVQQDVLDGRRIVKY